MQPSQTCCSGFSVRCFTPGTKVSFRNFLPTTIVTKWRMDQKGSSSFHVNFNQTLIVKIVTRELSDGILPPGRCMTRSWQRWPPSSSIQCKTLVGRPEMLVRQASTNFPLGENPLCQPWSIHTQGLRCFHRAYWSSSEKFDKLIVKAREGGANSVGVWMQRRENIWIQLLQMQQRLEDEEMLEIGEQNDGLKRNL